MPRHHDLRIGRSDVDQVAHALHVRLPGEHPEVADEDRPDLLDHELVVVFLDRQLDLVGTTDGYADKLAFEESDPIREFFVAGRILVSVTTAALTTVASLAE